MASMHGRFATKGVICAGLTARPLSIEPLESWIDQRDIAIPPPLTRDARLTYRFYPTVNVTAPSAPLQPFAPESITAL